jgi:hypothetical protein
MKIRIYSFKHILFRAGIIVIDLAVYMFLGLMMMSYDDFYDESKGEYWSWESMTTFDKSVVIGLYFWHAVNIIGICYIILKFVRGIRQTS